MSRDDRDRRLELDSQICFALYAASRAIVRAYDPLLAPLGVTYPQYLALLVLWESDDISVGALGHRLALDSATLTPLLKRLEAQGLIERRRNPDDERVVLIALTARGRALKAKVREIPFELACRAGFDPADAQGLARLAALRDELADLTRRLGRRRDDD
jgi:DNA-binding MarR family transcriptional regulator